MNLMMSTLGVILAGGRSSRFGSNKALAECGGVAMIEHVARSMSRVCDSIIVSGDPAIYSHLGYRVIADRSPGLGPVGGIASVLADAEAQGYDRALIATCDMPLVSSRLMRQMADTPIGENIDALLPADSSGATIYRFPMAVRTTAAREAARAAIAAGELSVKAFLARLRTATVAIAAEQAAELTNVNRPSEMPQVENTIKTTFEKTIEKTHAI